MSSFIQPLEYTEKALEELQIAISKKSLRRTEKGFEKLKISSDWLKSQLPDEFIEKNFGNFNRHLNFIEHFLIKRDFNWIKSNFDDIKERDLPEIRSKIATLREDVLIRKTFSTNKVFIVHGHENTPVNQLKTVLIELGLNPIILHEQPSGSRTIIEKLEKYSDVNFAFIVLTPDDCGCLYEDFQYGKYTALRHRARQNVVLEFGYFIGRLGRDRVCCLLKGDVERPSDMQGIVYVPFKESINEVRDDIVKELTAVGFTLESL